MLKIEGQNKGSPGKNDGWYIDNEEVAWFFKDGEPLFWLDGNGLPNFDEALLTDYMDYAPFTRLTGRIIISND